MGRRPLDAHVARAIALLALAALAGCTTTGGLFSRGSGSSSTPRATQQPANSGSSEAVVTAGDIAPYLELMRQLIDGDPLTQSETFNTARDNAEYAPTKINRLNYALALSIPGQPGFDPEAAAQSLRALIAAGATLTPAERTLAAIQLNQVEQFQLTESSRQSLEQQLESAEARSAQERAAAVAAGKRPLEAENAELRAELEAAEAMLEALTNIEESLSGGQQ